MQYNATDQKIPETEIRNTLPTDIGGGEAVLGDENDKPVFGRFQTMEEAYQALMTAEEACRRLDELQKELENCRKELENYEYEAIARRNGFDGRNELELAFEVKQKELENYALAGSYLLPHKKRAEFDKLIDACRQKGVYADLSGVRRFFSPEIVALVSEDATLFKHERAGAYAQRREQEKQARYRQQIEAFKAQEPEWTGIKFNNDLIRQAVELSDGRVDLKALKNLVMQIASDAIGQYQNEQRIRQENESLQSGLSVSEDSKQRPSGKKWLTKEAYYRLSPEEEAEKYDSIVEQIRLENQGLLPRMLTRQ